MATATLKYNSTGYPAKYNYAWNTGSINYGDRPNYEAGTPSGYVKSIGWIDIEPNGSNIYLNSISLYAAKSENSIVYAGDTELHINPNGIPQATLKVNNKESNTIQVTKHIEVDTPGGGTTSFGADLSQFQLCKFTWSGRGCLLSPDWNNIYLKYNTNGNIFIAPNNGISNFVSKIEFTVGTNTHVKIDANTWKTGMCYIKENNVWKLSENVYVKVNNLWKQGI